MSELVYKISMIGPTRVGKTSVVASMLDVAKDELLQGTPLTFKPKNLETEKKIKLHARELTSSIRAGNFNSGAVAGTQAPFTFNLALQAVNQNQQILDFAILDFPGGWIDSCNRPENAAAAWENCKNWIHDSSVLIIPIESTVLMQAKTDKEKGAIEYNLHTNEIKEIVEEWAKYRNAKLKDAETAIETARYLISTVIFVPVKCESYFNDNAHKQQKDRSQDLFTLVQKAYKSVIDVAKNNLNHPNAKLEILYIPIDTIGVVNIIRGHWKLDHDTLRFSAKYRITGEEVKPKGADDIFIALCKNIINTQIQIEQFQFKELSHQAKKAQQAAEQAHAHAERDEGVWENLKLWLTDEREQRRSAASQSAEQAQSAETQRLQQAEKANQVAQVVADIAKRESSSRVKKIV